LPSAGLIGRSRPIWTTPAAITIVIVRGINAAVTRIRSETEGQLHPNELTFPVTIMSAASGVFTQPGPRRRRPPDHFRSSRLIESRALVVPWAISIRAQRKPATAPARGAAKNVSPA
jgi:hypothetical protein